MSQDNAKDSVTAVDIEAEKKSHEFAVWKADIDSQAAVKFWQQVLKKDQRRQLVKQRYPLPSRSKLATSLELEQEAEQRSAHIVRYAYAMQLEERERQQTEARRLQDIQAMLPSMIMTGNSGSSSPVGRRNM